MPGRLAFDEAMQFPRSRLLVPDPELREGQVEMVGIKTRRGLIRRPWGLEGGFAVVYKFRTRSGQARALRCFHVDMKPDTEERYRRIASYFAAQTALQAVTVSFTYYREGIVVKEQGRGEVCPLIAMEWVEGRTLCEAVHLYCNQGNRVALRELSQRWQELVLAMRASRMAHGDLAGSNILVRDDGRLVLVDYDGVYIPPLAGYPPVLAGQEDYQHPQMRQRPYNEETDAFSALVITTALKALASDPTLWQRYARLDAQGNPSESLLFTAEDFADPRHSRLFQELLRAREPLVRKLTEELQAACLQPVQQVCFPFALLDPNYGYKQALKDLEEAIANDDDEAIIRAWQPLLEKYGPAQSALPRVELARRRLAALRRWCATIASSASLAAILASYDSVLDGARALTESERCLLSEGRRLLEALTRRDDETALEAAAALSQYYGLKLLSAQEQAQLQEARERQRLRQSWREARRSGEIEAVALAYVQAQRAGLLPSEEEERLGKLAARFWELVTDPAADDEALLEAYEAIALSPLAAELHISAEQRQRAELAERRLAALARLRMALGSRRLRAVAEADDPLLETCTALAPEEKERLELARCFYAAVEANDDASLVMLGEQLEQEAATSTGLRLSPKEWARLELARKRWRAYSRFLSALHSRQPRLIAAAAHPLLAEMQLSANERTLLALAQEFAAAYEDDRRLVAFYERLLSSPHSAFFQFSPEEQQRLHLLWKQEQQWRTFEQALATAPQEPAEEGPRRILAAYNALSEALLERLSAEHRRLLEQARQALELLHLLRQEASPEQLAPIYPPELLETFPSLLNSVQRQRLEGVLLLKELQRAWRACDYRRMLLIARAMPQPQELERYGLQLRIAARRLAEMLQPPGVLLALRPAIDGNHLIISWRWTTDPLLRHVLICWHTQALPPLPQPLYPGQLEQIGHYRIVSHPEPAGQGTASLNLTVGSCTRLHVVVCALLPEDWGQGVNGRFVEQDGRQSDWQAADRPWWLGRVLCASLALGTEVALS
jgi:hypothetical protein